MKNYYVRLVLVILIVVGLAQVIPEAVNLLLGLILASMLIIDAAQYSKLIATLQLGK
jgi:hypothetical protein